MISLRRRFVEILALKSAAARCRKLLLSLSLPQAAAHGGLCISSATFRIEFRELPWKMGTRSECRPQWEVDKHEIFTTNIFFTIVNSQTAVVADFLCNIRRLGITK